MRVLVLAAFGLSLLACMGKTSTTPPPPPDPAAPATPTAPAAPAAPSASTLPAEWAALSLPIGDGEVVVADDDKLLVAYDTGSLTTLSDAWVAALNAQGYQQREDVSSPGVTALVFGKGGQLYGLATGQEEGSNFAYMEDLGRVKNSAIRGKHLPGLGGRRRHRPGGPGGPGGPGAH